MLIKRKILIESLYKYIKNDEEEKSQKGINYNNMLKINTIKESDISSNNQKRNQNNNINNKNINNNIQNREKGDNYLNELIPNIMNKISFLINSCDEANISSIESLELVK